MNDILFSICITSYNRVSELDRLLRSIDSIKYVNRLEIIVSEDKSPRKEEIQKIVDEYRLSTNYKLRFNTNKHNLGYDRNLGKLKDLASGKYILYMSDDDKFNSGLLDSYFDYIVEHNCSLAFQPFSNVSGYNREYRNSFYIEPSEVNAAKHINDSILFSGLTFKKEVIDEYDSEKFLNTYYFQVYMFLSTLYKYGAYYINIPLVACMGDGQNGFGLSESSINNEFLINRESIFSKLEFHKGLLHVIDVFDIENGLRIKELNARNYTIRRLPDMCRARIMGKEDYRKFLKMLESLDINLTFEYNIYKTFIFLFGGRLTMKIFSMPKYFLLKYIKEKKR
jgi:glycosyltransferase involved in cell wall biosynthesis